MNFSPTTLSGWGVGEKNACLVHKWTFFSPTMESKKREGRGVPQRADPPPLFSRLSLPSAGEKRGLGGISPIEKIFECCTTQILATLQISSKKTNGGVFLVRKLQCCKIYVVRGREKQFIQVYKKLFFLPLRSKILH